MRGTHTDFGLPHKIGAARSWGCHLGSQALGLGLTLAVVLGEAEEVLGLGHSLGAGGDRSSGFLGAFGKVWEQAAGWTGGGCGARGGPGRAGA